MGNDVIEYIAQNVKSNIRELEGSMNKVIALANLEKTGRSIWPWPSRLWRILFLPTKRES